MFSTQNNEAQTSKSLKWLYIAISFSVLIIISITILYYSQQQILKDYRSISRNIREARIDLSKGFLFFVLSDTVKKLPYDQNAGLALINQAGYSFEKNLKSVYLKDFELNKDLNSQLLLSEFNQQLKDFIVELKNWDRLNRNPEYESNLRINFYKLEQNSEKLDLIISSEFIQIQKKYMNIFYASLMIAGFLLNLICFIVFFVLEKERKTTKKLIESQLDFKNLFTNMSNGLVYLQSYGKRDYIILKYNYAFGKITGFKDIEGKLISEILPEFLENLTPKNLDENQNFNQNKKSQLQEIFIKSISKYISINYYSPKNGFLLLVLEDVNENVESKIRLIEKNNEYLALNEEYVSINEELNKNLNETTKINQELLIAKEKAVESDRLKTAFLQNLSHEIRTPLNAINGFSSILNDYFDNKERLTEFTDIIKQRSNDLLQIIDDILNIALIESGQLKIHNDTFQIQNIFHELKLYSALLLKKAKKEHLEISFSCDDKSYNKNYYSDPLKIKQILENLISNAIKFTSIGTIEVRCVIIDKEFLQFTVVDTGFGIPQEMQASIFERFIQIHHEGQEFQSGTGIGLSIVKGLINLLQGEIKLISTHGEGFTFLVNVPLVEIPDLPQNEINKKSSVKFTKTYKVLVIEDDYYNALYLKELLNNAGLITIVADTAAKGLQCIKQDDFDIVLLDIRLPDKSGLELIHSIKELKPELLVIAQTAYASNEDKKLTLESGFDDYISKPIIKQELISLLDKYLSN